MHTQEDEVNTTNNESTFGMRLSKTQISRVLNPHKTVANQVMEDLSTQIRSLEGGLNQYQQEQSVIPPSKQQIIKILKNSYNFTPTYQNKLSKVQTKLHTSYLHVSTLNQNHNKQLAQTKFETMSMALSNKQIKNHQRKGFKSDDVNKKRKIMHSIQMKITLDDQEKRNQIEISKQCELQKVAQESDVGQLTLTMITDLRQKYFNELTSSDINEKFKRIKEIKDQIVPQQMALVRQGYANIQKQQLQHDLLSKKSQFNSYYQLLALEKTMRKVVALKLKPQIKSYSRFTGAEVYNDYGYIDSKVKEYIHTNKHSEIQN